MTDAPCELTKQRLDYAWKWFVYHADQRVKLFNYMIVATGILATGAANALKTNAENYPVAAILSLLGICFGFAFRQLDKRNSTLVWFGEDVLRQIERDCLFSGATLKYTRAIEGMPYLFEQNMGILNREAGDITKAKSAKGAGKTEDDADSKIFAKGYKDRLWKGKHRFWFPAISFAIIILFSILLAYTIYMCFRA